MVKNKEDGSRGHYCLGKQDEQRRSAFVRQMLHNLENFKDMPNIDVAGTRISEGKAKTSREEKVIRRWSVDWVLGRSQFEIVALSPRPQLSEFGVGKTDHGIGSKDEIRFGTHALSSLAS